jgi:phospholipid-transporting ATPase
MEFKKFSCGPNSYGTGESKYSVRVLIVCIIDADKKQIDHVNFVDPKFYEHFENEKGENYKYVEEVLLHLALCHSIIIDERKGTYNASSPDELALVNAAKFFGAVFERRDEENNVFITFKGQEQSYKLLNMLEFTSARKRMSVILQDKNGKIMLMTKGADSIILPRLNKDKSKYVDETLCFIEAYAREGLRTLLLA